MERMLMEKAAQNQSAISGSLELLPVCNMNCDMCYVRLSYDEMMRQGGVRTLDEWLHIARQMWEAGVLFLLLTGGEPLLYPNFKELFLELKKMGMILTINTNGTLIDEDMAEFFGKNKPRRINITLYGTSEKTYEELCHYPGGYEKVLKGIRLLKEQNVDVKLAGSLTKKNKEEIFTFVEVGKRLGCPVRIDTYMMPAVRERQNSYNFQARLAPKEAAKIRMYALKAEMGEELFKRYMEEMILKVEYMTREEDNPGHMNCFAGRSSFTINWKGEMRPCVILNEPSISVMKVGFQEAWKYMTRETKKIVLNPKCSTCKLRPLCRTCAASALMETGDYTGIPDYMCQYAEESFRLLKIEYDKIDKRGEV